MEQHCIQSFELAQGGNKYVLTTVDGKKIKVPKKALASHEKQKLLEECIQTGQPVTINLGKVEVSPKRLIQYNGGTWETFTDGSLRVKAPT